LDEAKFRLLFSIADVNNTGLISFNEYVHFEDIINKPDAEYVLAFKIFDRDGNGRVSKGYYPLSSLHLPFSSLFLLSLTLSTTDDFRQVVSTSFLSDSKIPFDFDCELVRLYFGKGGNELNYSQFTQLLKDLQQERVKQEFRFYDKEQSGYV
jgi:solute carrier family 25 (mitochondrial aspartate/glutamate transporter), member 12/13